LNATYVFEAIKGCIVVPRHRYGEHFAHTKAAADIGFSTSAAVWKHTLECNNPWPKFH